MVTSLRTLPQRFNEPMAFRFPSASRRAQEMTREEKFGSHIGPWDPFWLSRHSDFKLLSLKPRASAEVTAALCDAGEIR